MECEDVMSSCIFRQSHCHRTSHSKWSFRVQQHRHHRHHHRSATSCSSSRQLILTAGSTGSRSSSSRRTSPLSSSRSLRGQIIIILVVVLSKGLTLLKSTHLQGTTVNLLSLRRNQRTKLPKWRVMTALRTCLPKMGRLPPLDKHCLSLQTPYISKLQVNQDITTSLVTHKHSAISTANILRFL